MRRSPNLQANYRLQWPADTNAKSKTGISVLVVILDYVLSTILEKGLFKSTKKTDESVEKGR